MTAKLETLLRLRRLAVDDARMALAGCIRDEVTADAALAAADKALERETAAAARMTEQDPKEQNPREQAGVAEAFAHWLRHARDRRAALQRQHDLAATRTHEVRAVLSAGRLAVEAVETLIAQQASLRALDDARRDQHALEESVRGRIKS